MAINNSVVPDFLKNVAVAVLPGCLSKALIVMAPLVLVAGVILVSAPQAAAQSSKSQPLIKVQGSRAINPVYPFEALIGGKGGMAEVSFTVNTDGRAILLSTENASERPFAMALQADIEAIEFIPPRRNGVPQMTMTRETFVFLPQPNLDLVAQEILTELRKPAPSVAKAAELDAKPEAIRQPAPAYPGVLRGDEISGEAVVEFVVDRNGRCLFPRIISSSHEDFGWAAATGVLRWKYKSPTKGGVKVDTLVTATVVFDVKKAVDMW